MNIQIPSATKEIVDGLSDLIAASLKTREAQRHFPVADADKMDAIIKFEGTRVRVLRDIRERLENEMARPMEGFDV